MKNIQGIVDASKQAYERLDPNTLNNTFLTLQMHMESALKVTRNAADVLVKTLRSSHAAKKPIILKLVQYN